MPSYLSSHSSRIRKPGQAASLRRHTSSPFAASPRIKPLHRTQSAAAAYEDAVKKKDDKLEDGGDVLSVITVPDVTSVLDAVNHASRNLFCALPDRAGMNSVRIAQVLNFQRSIPHVASLAHLHALLSASSKTERDLSTLVANGEVHRLKIVGRGNDVSGVSDLLITNDNLKSSLQRAGVAQDAISSFMSVRRRNPRATTLTASQLLPSHLTALIRAGFLVVPSVSGQRNLSLSGSSLVATSNISRASSGSAAAIGGEAAFEHLGGVNASQRQATQNEKDFRGSELNLSVPNIGPYIRLLNAGREYLLELLGKSKFKQAPMYLLRERWDGAIDDDSIHSKARQERGLFSEVMPAKTKKWKKLSGLNFDWALEECLGAGLIELFETRSVGLGVRALA